MLLDVTKDVKNRDCEWYVVYFHTLDCRKGQRGQSVAFKELEGAIDVQSVNQDYTLANLCDWLVANPGGWLSSRAHKPGHCHRQLQVTTMYPALYHFEQKIRIEETTYGCRCLTQAPEWGESALEPKRLPWQRSILQQLRLWVVWHHLWMRIDPI